jgi:hypothetical protein
MQPARSSGAHDPAARPTREVLLATKVCVPHPRPGLVPRQRLVERLVAGTQRELVVVCGPAGFGKSSLLADWAHRGQRTVAWLSLDEDDNDPSLYEDGCRAQEDKPVLRSWRLVGEFRLLSVTSASRWSARSRVAARTTTWTREKPAARSTRRPCG